MFVSLKPVDFGRRAFLFSLFILSLFSPPSLNSLIYDFKPTHCAGWVCLISHHLKNKRPMERSPFRVNPWQCLCVFLVLFPCLFFCLFPCFSVFVRGNAYVSSWPISVFILLLISVKFRVNPWQIISSDCFYIR